jgi:hypothetical protein
MAEEREKKIAAFLEKAGWGTAARAPLACDASTRAYERLSGPEGRAVLMNAPAGPDGPPLEGSRKAYSAIAHLAEDCRPFVAVGEHLRTLGLSAPRLLAHDMEAGLLLLEDLGDDLYGKAIETGKAGDGTPLDALYRAAIDALLLLHQAGTPAALPLPDGSTYKVPSYDEAALAIETELLTDWYIPVKKGAELAVEEKDIYRALWKKLFPETQCGAPVLVLRDYHSPNLLWLGEREGPARAGMLDYQDAQVGSRAYDLVSLLQDARKDVPEVREEEMLAYYIEKARAGEADFDETAFRAAYAVLGAQRNAKIMGIFVRLWRRDGKPGYLAHLPRVSAYLERDLRHPVLSEMKAWLDTHVPAALRKEILQTE